MPTVPQDTAAKHSLELLSKFSTADPTVLANQLFDILRQPRKGLRREHLAVDPLSGLVELA